MWLRTQGLGQYPRLGGNLAPLATLNYTSLCRYFLVVIFWHSLSSTAQRAEQVTAPATVCAERTHRAGDQSDRRPARCAQLSQRGNGESSRAPQGRLPQGRLLDAARPRCLDGETAQRDAECDQDRAAGAGGLLRAANRRAESAL